jgi:hypothetical protein
MRTLSLRAAQRCETSDHSRCRCRCGGALHGARRGLDETYFLGLPEDDPHRAVVRKPKQPKPPKAQMKLFEE